MDVVVACVLLLKREEVWSTGDSRQTRKGGSADDRKRSQAVDMLSFVKKGRRSGGEEGESRLTRSGVRWIPFSSFSSVVFRLRFQRVSWARFVRLCFVLFFGWGDFLGSGPTVFR